MIPKLLQMSVRVMSCQKGVQNGAGPHRGQHINQDKVLQTTASSTGPSASFLTLNKVGHNLKHCWA